MPQLIEERPVVRATNYAVPFRRLAWLTRNFTLRVAFWSKNDE